MPHDSDPHRRTDGIFDALIGQAEMAEDPATLTVLLLRGMHEIATLLIELEIGQAMMLDQRSSGDDDE